MPSTDHTKKAQQGLLKYVDELAEQHKVKLDYSEKSLKAVDTVLEHTHNDYAKSELTQEDQNGFHGIALILAAYLIEVIERTHGEGTWQKDDPQFGVDSWPYTHGDTVIFPVDWAIKMIMDGKSESVAKKYETFFNSNKSAGAKWGWPGGFGKRNAR